MLPAVLSMRYIPCHVISSRPMILSSRIVHRPLSTYINDPHSVLGVSRDASEKDIKRAYHLKIKTLHPDVNPSPEARKEYDRTMKAYEMLKEPRSQSSMGGGYSNPFGGSQQQQQQQQQQQYQYQYQSNPFESGGFEFRDFKVNPNMARGFEAFEEILRQAGNTHSRSYRVNSDFEFSQTAFNSFFQNGFQQQFQSEGLRYPNDKAFSISESFMNLLGAKSMSLEDSHGETVSSLYLTNPLTQRIEYANHTGISGQPAVFERTKSAPNRGSGPMASQMQIKDEEGRVLHTFVPVENPGTFFPSLLRAVGAESMYSEWVVIPTKISEGLEPGVTSLSRLRIPLVGNLFQWYGTWGNVVGSCMMRKKLWGKLAGQHASFRRDNAVIGSAALPFIFPFAAHMFHNRM
eukprot:TRINITY_DN500_c1_g1_i1.p1 TRINITY_DN500_c1_g1~~TRINITY_DN500_c1_g1_i1.p1  ORF type:complete len:404 (-),score=112.22 TRINITY_DN500_c1_g1_i1:30-1241(-)